MNVRRRFARTTSGTIAALALVAIAVSVVVVPLMASRDPLLIRDVLARRLVPPLGRDTGGAWHVLVPIASDATSSCE